MSAGSSCQLCNNWAVGSFQGEGNAPVLWTAAKAFEVFPEAPAAAEALTGSLAGSGGYLPTWSYCPAPASLRHGSVTPDIVLHANFMSIHGSPQCGHGYILV